VDEVLERQGRARHVAMTTRYFLGAPELCAQTDCVLTLPTRLCEAVAKRLPLKMYDLPFAMAPFSIYRVSSKLYDSAPAMTWFASQLAKLDLC
jgi:hypothetical protein